MDQDKVVEVDGVFVKMEDSYNSYSCDPLSIEDDNNLDIGPPIVKMENGMEIILSGDNSTRSEEEVDDGVNSCGDNIPIDEKIGSNSRNECPDCGDCFRDSHQLRSHRRGHGSGHKCPHCPSSEFTIRTNLLSHMRRSHSEIMLQLRNDVKCHVCQRVCGSKDDLARHSRIIHGIGKNIGTTKEKEKKCDECGEVVTNSDDLVIHKKVHGPGFKCPHCSGRGGEFISFNNLKRHNFNFHAGKGRLRGKSHFNRICPYCSIRCKTNDSLNKHCVSRHKGKEVVFDVGGVAIKSTTQRYFKDRKDVMNYKYSPDTTVKTNAPKKLTHGPLVQEDTRAKPPSDLGQKGVDCSSFSSIDVTTFETRTTSKAVRTSSSIAISTLGENSKIVEIQTEIGSMDGRFSYHEEAEKQHQINTLMQMKVEGQPAAGYIILDDGQIIKTENNDSCPSQSSIIFVNEVKFKQEVESIGPDDNIFL